MSLYGALFSGVSGLSAQGSVISILGDNISNINTVGYKGGSANFSTMLTDSSSTTSYSSGGVQATARQLIDKQGLIQGTGVVTDLAVSGDGFFVVNSSADGTGNTLYTRAGSFRKDDRGNFLNSAGYALMAWQLDGEGRLPGQPGNLDTTSNALLDSLRPVNIKSVSGTAAATTTVDIGINLNAAQEILQGAGQTITFPSTALGNEGIASTSIIVPEQLAPSSLLQGNSITLTTGALTNYSYEYIYGGVVGTDATPLLGAATPSAVFSTLTNGDDFTLDNATAGTLTFTYTANSPSASLGQFNSLNTLAEAIDQVTGLSARVKNNILYISPDDAREGMTFADGTQGTLISAGLGGSLATGTATTTANRFSTLDALTSLINDSTGVRAVLENPLDSSQIDVFAEDPLDTLQFTASQAIALVNDAFTSGAAASTDVIVTHTAHGLAVGDVVEIQGASAVDGITVADGVYTITAITANTYTITGSAGTATVGATAGGGVNIRETTPYLGITPFVTTAAGDAEVTVTQAAHGLAIGDIVNFPGSVTFDGVTISGAYTVTSIPTAGTYTFDATGTATVGGVAGGGATAFDDVQDAGNKVLKEFGLITQTSANLAPAYDPIGSSAGNMATGEVTPQFSRNVRMFDALGTGHDFQMSYVKIANNTWGIEIYALDPDEISSTRTDGLIAYGTVIFNGDGSLRSVTPDLTDEITITWTNGATPNVTAFNFGTAGQVSGTPGATAIGLTDGLRQFDAAYDVSFVEQNGVSSGLLTSINIDVDGFVNANFSNGETRQIYKVPLADFTNPNGLTAKVGNVYSESQASGNFNLKEVGTGGIGKISPASLEASNIELSDELTRMIIAQRGYQASSKVIKTADDLLDNLIRTFS